MLSPDILSLPKIEGLALTVPSSQNDKHPFKRIAVEGNIGCGKTTFLEHFRACSGVEVIAEPVDKWMNINGFNCFDLMYKDPHRWSQAFQSYVTLTMLENHEQEEKPGTVKMIERSVHSARHCFIENLRQKDLMSDMEYCVINEWHDWLADNAETGLDLIVYLQATPETCRDRIKIRNRSEESTVALDYLQELHRLHEDWLIHQKKGPLPAPVLVIDADKDLAEVKRAIEELTPAILGRTASHS